MNGALAVGAQITATVTCPATKLLLGGGGSATSTQGNQRVVLQSSRPLSTTQWQVIGVVAVAINAANSGTVQAFAICTA